MQIFLEGKLFGIDDCLLAPAAKDPDRIFTGRSHWISLLSEVLPRALLAELGLAKILLGSSGGGQFLLVIPDEFRAPAEAFLDAAARDIAALSGDTLKLVWSITENLGDWSDVRKRLQEQLGQRRGTPNFESVVPAVDAATEDYFAEGLGFTLRDAESIGWSPETPGRILRSGGKHTWQLTDSPEAIPFARHAAPSDDLREPASTAVLAHRADGLETWGVLRGDVDNFAIRIHRAQTIEEHIQLSVMYKQFFAGELEVLCSMAEFWRKVTVIYSGGDDFAIYGAWDALIGLAGEMERVFRRFAERNLKDFTGPEGKTISMALALAPAADASLGAVFEEAGQRLEAAKSADKDCIWLLGRTLEWKQFAESGTLKDSLARMVSDFGCSPQYLKDLCGIYRETQSKMSKRQARRSGGERPWRYHRRIRRILNASRAAGPERNDFQKARAALIADLIGRSAVTVKLRPAGRVALEWARLSRSKNESGVSMDEEVKPNETQAEAAVAAPAPAPAREAPKPEGQRPPRQDRPPRPPGENRGGENRGGENRGDNRGREQRGGGGGGGDRGGGPRPDRGGDRPDRGREGGRPGGGGRPFDGPSEIELEKLIADSLYLDNHAHAVVMRMRDMDSGTKSQLRRLYNAVRRAVRAPENERQHQFVMLRARLAYTIARHSLRSLDALERLLLQVTRRNDAKGYERFKDLFEAIVAYNE